MMATLEVTRLVIGSQNSWARLSTTSSNEYLPDLASLTENVVIVYLYKEHSSARVFPLVSGRKMRAKMDARAQTSPWNRKSA